MTLVVILRPLVNQAQLPALPELMLRRRLELDVPARLVGTVPDAAGCVSSALLAVAGFTHRSLPDHDELGDELERETRQEQCPAELLRPGHQRR